MSSRTSTTQKAAAVKAILFDLDGTLIDTTDLILNSFAAAFNSVCGFSVAPRRLLQTFGTPLHAAMKDLLESTAGLNPTAVETPHEAALIDRLVDEYRAFNRAHHDSLARPFTGVRQTVDSLRERGYSLGLVTSKSRAIAERGLRLCALDSLMEVCIFLEDTAQHKPNPEPIQAALARLDVLPDAACYVGDSPHDVVAGRAAGVTTVAALWGPLPVELMNAGPDLLAATAPDLLNLFEPAGRPATGN